VCPELTDYDDECSCCQTKLILLVVVLTSCGGCYRGKGDYHRLGHGTDDHVRRPRRVTALQGKKIISIACGSLHCVAVSDSGTNEGMNEGMNESEMISSVFEKPT